MIKLDLLIPNNSTYYISIIYNVILTVEVKAKWKNVLQKYQNIKH